MHTLEGLLINQLLDTEGTPQRMGLCLPLGIFNLIEELITFWKIEFMLNNDKYQFMFTYHNQKETL